MAIKEVLRVLDVGVNLRQVVLVFIQVEKHFVATVLMETIVFLFQIEKRIQFRLYFMTHQLLRNNCILLQNIGRITLSQINSDSKIAEAVISINYLVLSQVSCCFQNNSYTVTLLILVHSTTHNTELKT